MSSFYLIHLSTDFVAIPSPQWLGWKAINILLVQMANRCGPSQGQQVVLHKGLGVLGDVADVLQLLPKYFDVGLSSRDAG